ncbi:hypothetical protein SBV1_3090008 [Verrucomicrobia bacterium]|nr:hypothetical protein SBV1_3090008 [Verrucomicrobiota bacterium]
MAIFESIRRRLEKQQQLLEELENLTPPQRARRLAQLQGRLDDAEQDEDDLDEAERDQLADSLTDALELDQLRAEIAALQELIARARRVRDQGADSKLTALHECLTRAEFHELTDGRGKLLIFTEHRDTLNHLRQHLEKWGYTVTEIHGGMNPHERKRAQEDFRTTRQICVATEAAGEGINLQFCRLMINYDLPWNPTRLEQRLGRIHRIGQERDVHAFNFVASQSEEGQDIVEGRILARLLEKLEQMREVLADRVFDVVGEGSPPKLGVTTGEVVSGFFSFLGLTRLTSEKVIAKAIATGVEKRIFGYLGGGAPSLGTDGKYRVSASKVRFDTAIAPDEIDLDSGFILLPQSIPQPAAPLGPTPPGPTPPGPIPPGATPPGAPAPGPTPPAGAPQRSVELSFTADRDQLFTAWNAMANLAEMAGKVSVTVKAESADGFDKSKLNNGVLEPLREADLIQ